MRLLDSPFGVTRTILRTGVRVVVLDWDMPSMASDRLAELIRNNERLRDVAIVLVSADVERPKPDAVDIVVPKTTNAEDVTRVVRRFVRHRRRRASRQAMKAVRPPPGRGSSNSSDAEPLDVQHRRHMLRGMANDPPEPFATVWKLLGVAASLAFLAGLAGALLHAEEDEAVFDAPRRAGALCLERAQEPAPLAMLPATRLGLARPSLLLPAPPSVAERTLRCLEEQMATSPHSLDYESALERERAAEIYISDLLSLAGEGRLSPERIAVLLGYAEAAQISDPDALACELGLGTWCTVRRAALTFVGERADLNPIPDLPDAYNAGLTALTAPAD